MDQTKALQDLLEAADLLAMLEEVTTPSNSGRLSPSIVSGLRITLRNARDMIIKSHDQLANQIVAKAMNSVHQGVDSQPHSALNQTQRLVPNSAPIHAEPQIQFNRKDLRASLEKIITS